MGYRETIEELMPRSLVFPKHVGDMLLRQLSAMSEQQLEKLAKILTEEKEAMEKISI